MIHPMLGEAWLAMGANRLRTALTMLGMVIGVGSVVLMMAIGQGAQYAVAQTISTMGSNLYVIISGWTQQSGVRTGSGFGYTLKIGDADAIGELDDITQVAPVHQGTQQVVYGAKNWSTAVVGTTPSYLDARSWALSGGYGFDETDVRSATRVAVVGITVVENLFEPGENPIGKTIRINADGSVPADNPFASQGGVAAQIWSLGHRNILGLAFDGTGKLVATAVVAVWNFVIRKWLLDDTHTNAANRLRKADNRRYRKAVDRHIYAPQS